MIPGEKYYLFNHANGWENICKEQKNYEFFLKKLGYQIWPFCNLFAYCLMPKHFHLVLQVRNEEELRGIWQKEQSSTIITPKQLELKISKSFSNSFSSYTQAYNKVYNRMGSLFITSMKMETVDDDNYFCKVVHYTHANPVHHRFTKKMEGWPHSSYKIFLSKGTTKLIRDYVLEKFGGLDAFIKYHEQSIDLK